MQFFSGKVQDLNPVKLERLRKEARPTIHSFIRPPSKKKSMHMESLMLKMMQLEPFVSRTEEMGKFQEKWDSFASSCPVIGKNDQVLYESMFY